MLLVPDISDKGYLAYIQSEFGLISVSTLTCLVIAMLLIVLILVRTKQPSPKVDVMEAWALVGMLLGTGAQRELIRSWERQPWKGSMPAFLAWVRYRWGGLDMVKTVCLPGEGSSCVWRCSGLLCAPVMCCCHNHEVQRGQIPHVPMQDQMLQPLTLWTKALCTFLVKETLWALSQVLCETHTNYHQDKRTLASVILVFRSFLDISAHCSSVLSFRIPFSFKRFWLSSEAQYRKRLLWINEKQ